jgi:hypothetical protein
LVISNCSSTLRCRPITNVHSANIYGGHEMFIAVITDSTRHCMSSYHTRSSVYGHVSFISACRYENNRNNWRPSKEFQTRSNITHSSNIDFVPALWKTLWQMIPSQPWMNAKFWNQNDFIKEKKYIWKITRSWERFRQGIIWVEVKNGHH